MALITPLGSIPATPPEDVTAASVAYLPPGALLWLEGRVTAGSVGLRPYYWAAEPAAVGVLKGAWIPVGGDAVAGSGVVSFNVASDGGASQGSYTWRRASAYWVVVEESAVGVTYAFVHISTETSVSPA